MIFLALDSATDGPSVVLCDTDRRDGSEWLAFQCLPAGRGQADRLIELVAAVLAEAGLAYRDLDLLAVNRGPGSFTGIRSAVAAARGLALAAGLPVLAVNTLETLAAATGPDGTGNLLAALDARRGQVYAQLFAADLTPLSEPQALAPAQAAQLATPPLRLAGSGAELVGAALHPAPVTIERVEPDACAVARCARARLAAGASPLLGTSLRPLYLRQPDARPQTPLIRPPIERVVA